MTLTAKRGIASSIAEERRILVAAGREALAPELARVARDQQLAFSSLCAVGFSLATASRADRARLASAVRPVYDRIQRNAFTSRWIAQIRAMRATTTADVARCPTR